MLSTRGLYSIAQSVRLRAEEVGEDTLFHFEDKKMTFAEYHTQSSQTANGLLSEGVGASDRIAFLGKNSPVYFELIAAAAKIRAVVSPLNWRLAGPELEYVLNDSGAKIIFAGKEFSEVLKQIRPTLTAAPKIFLIDGDKADMPSYSAWQQQFSDTDPHLDISADDAILQLYTSGTTGRPKGVRRQLSGNPITEFPAHYAKWAAALAYTDRSVHYAAGPLYHASPLHTAMIGMTFGGCVIVNDKFEAQEAFRIIQDYKVTHSNLVPTHFVRLMRLPEEVRRG